MDVLSQMHLGYFLAAFVVYFLAIGVASCYLVARLGGWSTLARQYRTEQPLPAHKRRFQSGKMRASMSYNNILTVASDVAGLYLDVPSIMRLGHPRLFVPWAVIEIDGPKRRFFRDVQTLNLGPERTPLCLRVTLVEFLLAGKGESQSPVDEQPNSTQV